MSAKTKLSQQYVYICASTDEAAPAGVYKAYTSVKRLELNYHIKCVLSHSTIPVVLGMFPVTSAIVVHRGPKNVWKGDCWQKAGSIHWAKAAE